MLSRREILLSGIAISALHATSSRYTFCGDSGDGKSTSLNVLTKSPLNAEPSLERLVVQRITPVEQFYIRTHGNTPELDADTFHLELEGLVEKPRKLSLAELKSLQKSRSLEATLTCAGNRRAEMNRVKPTGGVQWNAGAIGNASWEGVLLADVLSSVEIKPGAKHVWFEGLDSVTERDGSVAPFGGSIPIQRAMQRDGRPALLAFAMNGKPLTPDHGFPLRTVVPGYIGARSVKWLGKIVVSDRPSPNHYMAEAYKLAPRDDKQLVAAADPILEFPVNAAICTPADGQKLRPGKVSVSGYALPSGANASIEKVQISLDEGKSWTTATFAEDDDMAPSDLLGNWRLWGCEAPVTAKTKSIIVRATDSSGNAQPRETAWNYKGYLQNAWHRIAVEVA